MQLKHLETAIVNNKLDLINLRLIFMYSKACLKRPLKRPKIGFQDQLLLNAGQKYCRSKLQGEHSEILSTLIKLPFVFKTFVLSIFEWPLKTGLTVYCMFRYTLAN